MPKQKPQFSMINTFACCYCKNLVLEPDRDAPNLGCGLLRNRNECGRLATFVEEFERWKKDGLDAEYLHKGCEKFEPSSLPAHPRVYKLIVRNNPRCKSIPIDKNALQTSYEFVEKIKRYLPPENYIGVRLQYRYKSESGGGKL
jgi:hypothetical protein